MDFTFPKEQHLCFKKDIDSLLEKGETVFRYPIKAYFRKGTQCDCNRLMVSVPKRNFKRAVKRNLLKRRLREAYRLNKSILDGMPSSDILFVYISKEIAEYEQIVPKVREILDTVASAE